MNERTCERCGTAPKWFPAGTPEAPWPHQETLDYCGVCSKDLCAECMAHGHCGHTPAVSGLKRDNELLEGLDHE
jgi:hypothetical protein